MREYFSKHSGGLHRFKVSLYIVTLKKISFLSLFLSLSSYGIAKVFDVNIYLNRNSEAAQTAHRNNS